MMTVETATTIGTSIEYYDFFVYGTAAALVFPVVFFPALGPAAGLTASFATFAVAFFARPVGAVVFGHYGDRLGRKRALVATLRSEEHTSELQSRGQLVCRLLLDKKNHAAD